MTKKTNEMKLDVKQIVEDYCEKMGYSQAIFASQLGMKPNTFWNMINRKDIWLSSLEKIADAMGYEIVLKPKK